ncbi:MAG: hypothetical protein OSA45_12380 [Halioglobus sp.]|nr:hypothetical protein [Halioglobus sp.]
MSPEQIRVVIVVYLSALLPLVLIPWLRRRQAIPGWVPTVYVGSFLLCALGWELWFTYGWVAGDAVDLRRADVLNRMLPIHINWLMNSLADAGAVCMGGLWLMWRTAKRDSRVFEQWQWWPFVVLFVWCIGQNIFVEMFLYHDQLAAGKPLSWAPLVPTGPWWNPVLFVFGDRTITLQGQVAWLIAPWILYAGTIAYVRRWKAGNSVFR